MVGEISRVAVGYAGLSLTELVPKIIKNGLVKPKTTLAAIVLVYICLVIYICAYIYV